MRPLASLIRSTANAVAGDILKGKQPYTYVNEIVRRVEGNAAFARDLSRVSGGAFMLELELHDRITEQVRTILRADKDKQGRVWLCVPEKGRKDRRWMPAPALTRSEVRVVRDGYKNGRERNDQLFKVWTHVDAVMAERGLSDLRGDYVSVMTEARKRAAV